MSHKAGHIIIESVANPDDSAGVFTTSRIEMEFPSGMSIDDRMLKVRQIMRAIDKLEHDDVTDEDS